jgi:O-acetyl-ADP-ribose deacetylase
MKTTINGCVLELIEGDITRQETYAIVTAANRHLAGGGGVDGAVHRAAGPQLLAACRQIGGCPTGEARLTPGFNLKARYVIHAVGPVYHGSPEDARLLAGAYQWSLRLARENGCPSIAFPAISTGVYGYPLEEAARVSLLTVIAELEEHPGLELVRFVLFGPEAARAHELALQELLSHKEN